MACSTKLRTPASVKTQQELFPATLTSAANDFRFAKSFIGASISSICFLRNIFPNDDFVDRKWEDENLKILKGKSPDCYQFVKNMRGVFDALERKYLREIRFGIYTDPRNAETVLESYVFNVQYSSDGTPSVTLGNDGSSREDETTRKVYRNVKQFLKKIAFLVSHLEALPDKPYLAVKLLYYDERTPADYEPQGYHSTNEAEFTFASENVGNVSFGKVQSNHYTFRAKCKSVFLDQNELEKDENPPLSSVVEQLNVLIPDTNNDDSPSTAGSKKDNTAKAKTPSKKKAPGVKKVPPVAKKVKKPPSIQRSGAEKVENRTKNGAKKQLPTLYADDTPCIANAAEISSAIERFAIGNENVEGAKNCSNKQDSAVTAPIVAETYEEKLQIQPRVAENEAEDDKNVFKIPRIVAKSDTTHHKSAAPHRASPQTPKISTNFHFRTSKATPNENESPQAVVYSTPTATTPLLNVRSQEVARCICGVTVWDNFMFRCGVCKKVQHFICYGHAKPPPTLNVVVCAVCVQEKENEGRGCLDPKFQFANQTSIKQMAMFRRILSILLKYPNKIIGSEEIFKAFSIEDTAFVGRLFDRCLVLKFVTKGTNFKTTQRRIEKEMINSRLNQYFYMNSEVGNENVSSISTTNQENESIRKRNASETDADELAKRAKTVLGQKDVERTYF